MEHEKTREREKKNRAVKSKSKEMGKIELMFLIILLGNVEKSVSLSDDDSANIEAVKIGERWALFKLFTANFSRL